MGERKVIQKYYPPDFDPKILPRGRKKHTSQIKVRMMLPMSIRCKACGEFMYKGTKFNSRKEIAYGENYLGIKVFRFYLKCTRCSAELTIKTDPKNSDYVAERGCSRNYEPWRVHAKNVAEEEVEMRRLEEEDAMKLLESKTKDSKKEMEDLAQLDEIKSMRALDNKISVDRLLNDQKLQMENNDSLNKQEIGEIAEKEFEKENIKVRKIDEEDYNKKFDKKYISKNSNVLTGKKRKANSFLDNLSIIKPKRKKRRKKK